MTFRQLGLSPEIAKACEEKGYKKATKIQEEAIVHLLRKKDLVAIAKTGTGKTAAFVLPLLQDIENQKKLSNSEDVVLTKLIIAPTRELVLQLEKSIESYSKYLDIKICSVYGGANIKPQIKKLDARVHIVIATTGRLMDLIRQEK